MYALKILFFGSMRAELDGEAVTFRSRKVKALLAYLALQADVPQGREHLATLLWGEQADEKSRGSLRGALAQLRKSLGRTADSLLTITPQTIQFNLVPDLVWVDAHEFAVLWRTLQSHPVGEWWRRAASIRHLRTMTKLYEGEFLAGLSLDDCPDFANWWLLQREQYHQQVLVALGALAEHELAYLSPVTAISYAQRQLALESWREVAHRQMMLAHLMMGQPQLARRQYEVCRQILAEELGIEPDTETQALWAEVVSSGGRPFVPPPVHNRPTTTTPFIGRQKTLLRLLPLLLDPDYRLLTLTGVGGVGKSRLALEAGAKMTTHFRDGVWFVPLAGVAEQADTQLMAETIASVVARVLLVTLTGQGTAQAQLLAALKRKELLLILDNFEHFQMGAEMVMALLAQCPAVKLLVTSRSRLNLQSEVHVPLVGLPVGEVTRPAAAVELFQERAGRVDFSFVLGEEERPLAIQLCRFLEGVPLSIELAAGWVDKRPLTEIVTTVAQDLAQMATTMADVPERQRSMRAVFAGSWRLLATNEQQTLARLALFRGGFWLEAAEMVGADTAVLGNLVEHFLLRQDANGRYNLHELLRQFALEKLAELGLLAMVQEAHGRYYLDFVAQREQAIRQEWRVVQAVVEAEWDNIRQSWAWAAEVMDVQLLTAVLPTVYALYRSANLFREGQQLFAQTANQVQRWLEQAKDVQEAERHAAQSLFNQLQIDVANFLNMLGRGKDVVGMMETAVDWAIRLGNHQQHALAELQWGIGLIGKGQFADAQIHLTEAQKLAETINDEELQADCLVHLGLVTWYQSDFGLAREYCQGSLYLSLKTGNKRTQMPANILLGLIAKGLNLFEEALQNTSAALAVAQQLQDRHWEGVARNNWGSICENMGDYEQAQMHYEQSLIIRRETGYLEGESSTLNNLGNAARHMGDLPLAQRYLQESLIIRQQMQDRNGEAWSLLNLGLVAREMGHMAEAVTYGEQAVAIWHEIGERTAEANALCALGVSLILCEQYEQAEMHLLAVLPLSEKKEQRQYEALARHNLGVLACERGQWVQAERYLQQALALRQGLNKRVSSLESQAWLAWLAYKQGDETAATSLVADVAAYLLEEKVVMGMERPFRIYAICYHILKEWDKSRAAALLAIAWQHVQLRASKFADETDRGTFEKNAPDHQLIFTEYQRKTP